MSRKGRFATAFLAVAGFAAVTGSFGGDVASANAIDDIQPLLTSSCSFDQIDAALRIVAPDSADRLDNAPLQKTMLRSMLAQPARQGAEMFARMASEQTRAGSVARAALAAIPMKSQVGPTIEQVVQTCHRYPSIALPNRNKIKVAN
jgi:hemophore-related protein